MLLKEFEVVTLSILSFCSALLPIIHMTFLTNLGHRNAAFRTCSTTCSMTCSTTCSMTYSMTYSMNCSTTCSMTCSTIPANDTSKHLESVHLSCASIWMWVIDLFTMLMILLHLDVCRSAHCPKSGIYMSFHAISCHHATYLVYLVSQKIGSGYHQVRCIQIDDKNSSSLIMVCTKMADSV